MGKIFKRTLATIMVVLMVLTSAPLGGFVGFDWKAFAVDDSQELILDTDDAITRAEWLHNLAVVFEMTVEDEIYPDNYFSDLEDTHEYYYDVLLNVNFGVVDVEAGGEVNPDGLVTRSFASHTLNFCLGYQLEDDTTYTFTDTTVCEYPADAQVAVNRGWLELVDGKFCPENSITDKEVRAMLDDTKVVLGDSKIDVDYDSEFTFSSEVIEVEDGTEIEVSDNSIIIYDSPVEITTDDIFAVYKSGIPLIYKAETVSVQENATIITTSYIDDTEGEYILEADAQGEADLEDVIITPAEGVDVDLNYEEEQVSLFAFGRGDGKKKLANISAKGSIKLGSLGYSVSYSVEMKDPTIKYAYNIGKRTAQVSLECEVETKTTLKVDLLEGYKKEVLIYTLGVPGVGGLDVYLKFDLSGSVSAVTKSSYKVGASYSPKDNFRSIKNFSSSTFSFQAKISGSAGVIIKLGITQLPLVKAYVYAEAGAKASVDLKVYSSGTPKNCVEFGAYVYANYGATFKLKAGIFSFEAKAEEKVWDSKTSPAKIVKHYEENKPVIKCTRGDSGSSGSGDSSGKSNYYTKSDSVYSGGWSDGDNSYGFNNLGEPVQLFEYSLDDEGNATITSYKGNATVVNIPETIDGHTVVGVGKKVFKGKSNIRNVDIPNSVTNIEDEAFAYCQNLVSVKLSDNLKALGRSVFYECVSLLSVNIPAALVEVDTYGGNYWGPFEGCVNLKNVKIEEGATVIPQCLFEGCASLIEIDIPDSIVSIERRAFAQCTGLTVVDLPTNLETIDYHAFLECTSLNTVYVYKNIKNVGTYGGNYWYPFSGCENLKTIILDEEMTSLPGRLFGKCSGLENISIPYSITSIGDRCFADCTSLKSIELPLGLVSLGERTFYNCTSLKSAFIPKTITNIDTYGSNYWYPFEGCSSLDTIVFAKGITKIPDSILGKCTGLTEMVIPDTVTIIGNNSFDGCVNLKELHIPDTVLEIGDRAFFGCTGLEKVKLPEFLKSIGYYAFNGCTNLIEIYVPKTIEEVNTYGSNYYAPFSYCSNLAKISFAEDIEKIPSSLFARCDGIESIIIPNTVTYIGENAFRNCEKLKNLTLPVSLERISTAAFYKCVNLTEIDLPDSLTQIDASAFACSGIERIVIPNSVTAMGTKMFQECTNLKSVVLPNVRLNIPEYIFDGCISLERMQFPSTVTTVQKGAFRNCASLKEVVMNDGLSTIEGNAFNNCDALTTISIPNSVTSFGSSVFYDCDILTNVTLGTGLTSLPASTFEHCDTLESVDLPYRVTTVGENAFKDCVKFTSITIPRATTSIASNTFSYPAKLTINGVAGTYAETYAKEIGAKFVDKQVNATAVTIDKPTVTLNKGQSVKLVMNVTPANFTDEVSWKSGNTDVATISADGTITAKSVGTATIKLTVGNVSASCKVTVVQPVTSIYIDKSSVTMQAHDTYQLTVDVNPDNAANKSVEWSSSAKDIASVDKNGLVTALKKGEATIRVDAKDGSGKYDTCKIVVSNNGVKATKVSQLESAHNYPVNCTDFWQYTLSGADSISVTFDSRTNIEDGFDYLYIYDGNKNQVGKYTGTELSGKTITVPGDTVRIQLASDDSGTEWGFKVTDVKIASAHEHTYTSKTTKAATCTKTGTKTFTCACGDTYTETIAKLGHKYSSSYTIDTDATCTTDGSKSKHCTRTGCTAKTSVTTISATGHSYGSYKTTKNATCTSAGSKQRTCSICSNVETATIAKLGHSYSSSYTTDKKATCTTDGSKSKHCTRTGCTAKTSVTAIAATGHSYGSYKTTKSASCTSAGSKQRTCSACGNTETTTIAKLGHSYSSSYTVDKKATCTTDGSKSKHCTRTGCTSKSSVTAIAKLGHTYDNACDTTCNRCSAKRTITHSYKNVTTKATLTKNGKVENKCSVCGNVKSTTTVYYPKTIKLSATKYTYNGKAKKPSVTVKDSKGNTLKKDTDYTVKYASGRKAIGKYTVTVTFKGKYSGTKKLTFNILPSKTSKITPTCTTTSIKASWKKVTGADGYKVELLNSKGKVVKTATTTKTAYTFKKLSKVTTYKVKVTAYKTIDKKKVYSTVSTTITTSTAPAKVTLSKVTAGKKTATPAWKAVSGASGYEVMYSTSSKFKSSKTATVKKGSTKKTTIKKLTKGKKYYFKVRAYKTVDGKKVYGAWSAVKNVKVK